jgi:tetratricopeptide (TPR) repeat protein
MMTFLNDDSKSFEDWIWDPKTREMLQRLEAMTEVSNAPVMTKKNDSALTHYFNDALISGKDDIPTMFIAAKAEKQYGKDLFSQKQFQGALTSFKKVADVLKPHIEGRNDFVDLYTKCCTNVAICAIKLRLWPVAREYVQFSLAHDKEDAKAWYCMSKLYLNEFRYQEATEAVHKALDIIGDDVLCHKLLAEIPVQEAKEKMKLELEQERFKQENERLKELAIKNAPPHVKIPEINRVAALPQPQVDDIAFS